MSDMKVAMPIIGARIVVPCSACGFDWYAPNEDCLLKHDVWPGGAIWRDINNNPDIIISPPAFQRILERLRNLEHERREVRDYAYCGWLEATGESRDSLICILDIIGWPDPDGAGEGRG